MQVQPGQTIEEIRESLQERKEQLLKEYRLINKQISETIDEVTHSRLDNKADGILEEITKVSDKLKNLNAAKPDFNRRHLDFQQNLSKIDFDQVINKIEKLIRKFRKKEVRGDALLIVQESLKMAGELCLKEIKKLLNSETGDFKHIEFEFSHTERLDKIGLLDGLAKYLGITFTQDEELDEKEYINTIIQKICHSLQGGSIVFLELRKWHTLPSQEKELFWFVTDFWIPLVKQLDVISQTHRQVKFISVIVTDYKLSSEGLNSLDLCSKENNFKILKLALRKWKVDDIELWLESYQGLTSPISSQCAKSIHRSSEGIPAIVCNALKQEFLK